MRGYLDVPAEARSVAVVRGRVGDLLAAAGHADVDVVLLLLSEIVSNSVRHSDSGRRPGGRITVAMATADDLIHIDVIDDGSAAPIPDAPPSGVAELNEGGRGLWLVQQLSTAWGWHEETGARVVWFEVTGWCDQRDVAGLAGLPPRVL